MFASKDLYAELHLQPTASASEIRAAYRRAALAAHPDKGGSATAFHTISFAFEVLSCPASRAIYDKRMKIQTRRSLCNHLRKAPSSHPVVSGLHRKRKQTAAAYSPFAKKHRNASPYCTVNSESCDAEDLGPDDAEDEPAAAPSHVSHDTHMALEHLRAAVQALPVRERKAGISRMPRNVRANLLTYMVSNTLCKLHPEPRFCKYGPRRVRAWNSQMRGTDVRAVTRTHKTTYQAQLRIRHLRMYTRSQDDINTAVGHQMVLVQARHALDGAAEEIWHDPVNFCSIFNTALHTAGSSLEELGLSVFVFMRADEWISRPATITSPVMTLEDAVATHSRLCKARQTSWEHLRAEWIPLMMQTQHARLQRLSQEQAMAFADRAHIKLLERRLQSAVAAAESALSRRYRIESKAAKVKALAELQARREKAAAVASISRAAARKRREWAARRRWYCNRHLTMEEIMQGPPKLL